MTNLFLIFAELIPAKNLPAADPVDVMIKNGFNLALALAGAIAVAFIIYGGIKYMISRGNPDEIKKARDSILYSVIGIVVVMIAFIVVNFVIGKF